MDELNNRRRHEDRRQSGSNLADGFFERRHLAERRLPEMDVLKLSDRDWQAYFGEAPEASEKPEGRTLYEPERLNKKRDPKRS